MVVPDLANLVWVKAVFRFGAQQSSELPSTSSFTASLHVSLKGGGGCVVEHQPGEMSRGEEGGKRERKWRRRLLGKGCRRPLRHSPGGAFRGRGGPGGGEKEEEEEKRDRATERAEALLSTIVAESSAAAVSLPSPGRRRTEGGGGKEGKSQREGGGGEEEKISDGSAVRPRRLWLSGESSSR
jgi:hypothetical protein